MSCHKCCGQLHVIAFQVPTCYKPTANPLNSVESIVSDLVISQVTILEVVVNVLHSITIIPASSRTPNTTMANIKLGSANGSNHLALALDGSSIVVVEGGAVLPLLAGLALELAAVGAHHAPVVLEEAKVGRVFRLGGSVGLLVSEGVGSSGHGTAPE